MTTLIQFEEMVKVSQKMKNFKEQESDMISSLLKNSENLKNKYKNNLVGKSYAYIYYQSIKDGDILNIQSEDELKFLTNFTHYQWIEVSAKYIENYINTCDMFSYMDNMEKIHEWAKFGKFLLIVRDSGYNLESLINEMQKGHDNYIVKIEE